MLNILNLTFIESHNQERGSDAITQTDNQPLTFFVFLETGRVWKDFMRLSFSCIHFTSLDFWAKPTCLKHRVCNLNNYRYVVWNVVNKNINSTWYFGVAHSTTFRALFMPYTSESSEFRKCTLVYKQHSVLVTRLVYISPLLVPNPKSESKFGRNVSKSNSHSLALSWECVWREWESVLAGARLRMANKTSTSLKTSNLGLWNGFCK
jgi:hypothetical protein